MNCATVVGQIVGLRAFTPRGLRRKLLAIGAEVISTKTLKSEQNFEMIERRG
jgi:hypothetical protein